MNLKTKVIEGFEPALMLTRPWWDVAAQRKTQSDVNGVVDGLTSVQRLVHLAGRLTSDDRNELADRLFNDGRQAYRDALQNELSKWGCHGSQAFVPDTGPELTAIRDRADWAAQSVTHTYNYELANAITAVGNEVPTANRHTYAFRLFYQDSSWDKGYWEDKSTQVAQIEMMTVINAAVADFYARNTLEPASVVITPYFAVCPICKDMVDGNPYDSVDDVVRQYVIPPHVGCPHHITTTASERLTPRQCETVWAGI
jgi:hypothetical protein